MFEHLTFMYTLRSHETPKKNQPPSNTFWRSLGVGLLLLFIGPMVFGQLDCGNAINQVLCERVYYDANLGNSNVDAYKSDPSELFAILATGKEVVHSIFWAGGDVIFSVRRYFRGCSL